MFGFDMVLGVGEFTIVHGLPETRCSFVMDGENEPRSAGDPWPKSEIEIVLLPKEGISEVIKANSHRGGICRGREMSVEVNLHLPSRSPSSSCVLQPKTPPQSKLFAVNYG